jgi:hypothetical protein
METDRWIITASSGTYTVNGEDMLSVVTKFTLEHADDWISSVIMVNV